VGFRNFSDVLVREIPTFAWISRGFFPACPFSILVRVLSRCRDKGLRPDWPDRNRQIGLGLDHMMKLGWTRAAFVLASVIGSLGTAQADRIKNPTAVFSGLDKITGRIVSFEVGIDETVQFGALQMTPRVCFTKPPTETPNTTSFIEVDEPATEGKTKRVFSGWLFAASPGLHGLEHPVYDIWLVDCKGGTEVIAEPKETPEELPPIQDTARAPSDAGRPGDIMAPTGTTAPRPPAVETAPLRQPARRQAPAAPIINTDR
jgi:hypothetical protein